jgi:hypothetical protein
MRITIDAAPFADHDDCLQVAAADFAAARGLEGWDLDPKWADSQRETIVLTAPEWAGDFLPIGA